LLILLAICFAIYVFSQLGFLCLSPVLESLRIRSEKRLEREAFARYGGRWLGLWSQEDEAINGLQTTLDISVSFVSRMAPRERIFLSDYLSLLTRPYYWLLAPVFNRMVRPFLDSWVRSFVVKTAQGNNRPAAEVVAVSPVPTLTSQSHRFPSLPGELDAQLVETANLHASGIAPKLRTLLSEPSFAVGLERFSAALSGEELVHTSYFDHGEILDLLAAHMAWACDDREYLERRPELKDSLLKWFDRFKSAAGEPCHRWLASRNDVLPSRPAVITPRRRLTRSLGNLVRKAS
jgi:hypothetical protein